MIALHEMKGTFILIHEGEFSYTQSPTMATPGALCYAAGKQMLLKAVQNPDVSCIITNKVLAGSIPPGKGVLIADDPRECYFEVHNWLVNEKKIRLLNESSISSKATLHSSVELKGNVVIEDDVVIEKDVILEANTVIRKGACIGNRVIIGAKGMQFNNVRGKPYRVACAGGVEIGAYTEVLDYAIIQRPYNYLRTVIGDYSKISVRVNIGHGCVIGSHCMIAGGANLAGNVSVGDHAWIGPSATIADGLSVGPDARVLLGSVVATHVPEGQIVSGNFAMEHTKQLKHYSLLKKG